MGWPLFVNLDSQTTANVLTDTCQGSQLTLSCTHAVLPFAGECRSYRSRGTDSSAHGSPSPSHAAPVAPPTFQLRTLVARDIPPSGCLASFILGCTGTSMAMQRPWRCRCWCEGVMRSQSRFGAGVLKVGSLSRAPPGHVSSCVGRQATVRTPLPKYLHDANHVARFGTVL